MATALDVKVRGISPFELFLGSKIKQNLVKKNSCNLIPRGLVCAGN